MDDLSKLLGQKKVPVKAPEVTKIEQWCAQNFPQFQVSIQKRTRDIIINVPNGPLAQEIQMSLLQIKEAAGLPADARITIKIG